MVYVNPRRFLVVAGLAFQFIFCVLVASCQTPTVFNTPVKEFQKLLAQGKVERVLALDENALADTGDFGPAAWYSLALWLSRQKVHGSPDTDVARPLNGETTATPATTLPFGNDPRITLEIQLLKKAIAQGSWICRAEASTLLMGIYIENNAWPELLDFLATIDKLDGYTAQLASTRILAYDAMGQYGQVLDETKKLAAAFPADAKNPPLRWLAFKAGIVMHQNGATKALHDSLLSDASNDWMSAALAWLQEQALLSLVLNSAETAALEMRLAVLAKDYAGAADKALAAGSAALSTHVAPAMIADTAKSFLYSGKASQGFVLFDRLSKSIGAPRLFNTSSGSLAWTTWFYRARLARASKDFSQAEKGFLLAADTASDSINRDAALWYYLDCVREEAEIAIPPLKDGRPVQTNTALQRMRFFDALVLASGRWKNPAEFSDMVDSLVREALGAHDIALLAAINAKLARSLPIASAARLAYIATRAAEADMLPGSSDTTSIAPPASSYGSYDIVASFAAIKNNPAFPLYYRQLSAWRLGENLNVARDPVPADAPAALPTESNNPSVHSQEIRKFIISIYDFFSDGLAATLFTRYSSQLSDADLRNLTADFFQRDKPDSAIRAAYVLSQRPNALPTKEEIQLRYPRPWLSAIKDSLRGKNIREDFFYGLLRSESLFQVNANSRAGARGLAQLMPATAAAAAKNIGLTDYDITTIDDNLAIGAYHLAWILTTTSKPIESLMAYNAGSTRLKNWRASFPNMPTDLLVEAIPIAETRQYCANILTATLIYNELYYHENMVDLVSFLMEGKPMPKEPGLPLNSIPQ